MDEQLRGRDALSPAYFAAGKKLLVDGVPDAGVARGDTVMLTMDSAIQAMVEEIDALVRQWNPIGTSIIVLDPRNGEVLALASSPTYDPDHPGRPRRPDQQPGDPVPPASRLDPQGDHRRRRARAGRHPRARDPLL